MVEPQIKQIKKEVNNSFKKIEQVSKKEENKNQVKYETIKSLPSWSIEPPLEIKRGV